MAGVGADAVSRAALSGGRVILALPHIWLLTVLLVGGYLVTLAVLVAATVAAIVATGQSLIERREARHGRPLPADHEPVWLGVLGLTTTGGLLVAFLLPWVQG